MYLRHRAGSLGQGSAEDSLPTLPPRGGDLPNWCVSSHNDADLHVLCGVELERGVRPLPSVLAHRRLTTHALQHALQASEWLEDTLSTIGELGDVSAVCACLCCLLGRLMPREFVRAASAVSSWSIVWRNLCSGGTIVSSCEAGRC